MASSLPATLENWNTHPHNKWAFINIDKLIPTAVIKKSKTPSQLPERLQDFQSFNQTHKDDNTTLDLPTYLTRTNTDGLLILHHGNIVYETYRNQNSPQTPHILMSITKCLTGLLIGILHSQGTLSVSDNVTKYVPEVSNTIWRETTIQQCLDMRVGARYDGSKEYRAATAWAPPLAAADKTSATPTLKHFLATFTPHEILPEDAADARFEYTSANTDLLGWVVERATGQSFADVLEQRLWQPLGAESDALLTLDADGLSRAAAGLCVTLRDLARLGQMMLHEGKNGAGEVVVPAEWMRDTLHHGSRDAWRRGNLAPALEGLYDGLAYRNCCYVDEESETMMGLGIFGQFLAVNRKNGIVFVSTASQEKAIDFGMIRLTLGAFREVQRVLVAT